MRTLAIETSCDDTSLAIVCCDNGDFVVEHMLTVSQTAMHDTYGGVVPELAYRAHAENILTVLETLINPPHPNSLPTASLGEGVRFDLDEIDSITVTVRPGLPGALLVGINVAHTLGILWDKPVLEVNHIMGHVFSILLDRNKDIIQLPYVCLTVSGGHTDIYVVEQRAESEEQRGKQYGKGAKSGEWHKREHLGKGEEIGVGSFVVTKLGQTRDDAAGEVFDKVARMLGGPYPGGAWIGKIAQQGGPDDRVEFRPSYLEKASYDVSFSGLKSQAYYLLETYKKNNIELDDTLKANIARAFQEAITSVLAKKLTQAVKTYDASVVGLVGGVAANKRLREKVAERLEKDLHTTISMYIPTQMKYCGDNAAMIGVVGLLEARQ